MDWLYAYFFNHQTSIKMNIKKLTPLVTIAAITLTLIAACKKDKEANKTPMQIEREKNDAYREDIFKRVSAYPYWIPTAITAETPVDIYKKGATTDVFSQRPEHQTDYYISVKRVTKYDNPELDSRLHFGHKTIQTKKEKMKNDGYKPDRIEEQIDLMTKAYFSLSKGRNDVQQIQWVKPFAEPEGTHGHATYQMTTFQNNELKLHYYDHSLKTTIHVTFTGSKTIPQ